MSHDGRPPHQAEDRIMLEGRCDCKAAVMEAGGGERERDRFLCQTAAVAAGQGLRAVTHAGTPCRSHTGGEGLCAAAQG